MIIAAIDPGFSGAIAVVNEEYDCETCDMPVMGTGAKKLVDGNAIQRFLSERDVEYAVIEQVSAMPKQGVSGMFRFGTSYGVALGVLQGMSIPYEPVTPQRWKKAMGVSSDKDHARRVAIERLPRAAQQFERKKDEGRAEAALMALWWFNNGKEYRMAQEVA
ncbi:hypothetical protein [Methyloceanibacter caenitepidi]|uniref:Uncharacterized protein n=1 Tax=Methyloceanibacter caenitepidi TaxID=1384459 RepID=A0A0A8K8M1_9HYPH|nr:hypothetical protein [Methyloceanibacter caenitepidi]BAQ18339.1 hypothetical protein GL4_2906 [Methyloceanibacter caenitepidi]